MEGKTVSVIVPVYNVEKYLPRCLESLSAQTYEGFEVILVDDGSTDGSGRICDEYSGVGVKVIHKENGGLSSARNEGLKHVSDSAEYILFVDSDDFIEADTLDILVKTSEKHGADIVIFQNDCVTENGGHIPVKRHMRTETLSNTEAMRRLFTDDTFGGTTICGKLFRKKLLVGNGFSFPEGRIHEDCFTAYGLFFRSEKTVYIPDVLYHYFRRPDSISGSPFGRKNLDKLDAAEEALDFVKENVPELTDECTAQYVRWNLQVINAMLRSGTCDEEVWEKIKNSVRSAEYLRIRPLPPKYKALAFLQVNSKPLYRLVFRLFYFRLHKYF